MKQHNIEFLEANRHHYTTLVNAGYIQHLDQATRQRILDIIHEEFNPGYIAALWCQSCIADMLKYCYIQFDKWIAARLLDGDDQGQSLPGILSVMEETTRERVEMTFPIQDEPATEAKELPQVDGTLFGKEKGNTKPITDSKPVGGPPPKPAVLPNRNKRRS